MNKYSYYWERKSKQDSYVRIKNIDTIVFLVCFVPMVIFGIIFNAICVVIK